MPKKEDVSWSSAYILWTSTPHWYLRGLVLVIDLQAKLNFSRVVALLTNPAEAEGQGISSKNGPVLIPALVKAKDGAIKDIQEVSAKFDIHSLVNLRPFDERDVFVIVKETPNIPIGSRSVPERIFGWNLPSRCIVDVAGRPDAIWIPGAVQECLRPLIHTGHYVRTGKEVVRPRVRVSRIASSHNDCRSAALVLLYRRDTPATKDLASSTASVDPFATGAKRQLVLV